MASNKSLDKLELIAALLLDIHLSHGVVFNSRALRLTLQKVKNRARSEGDGFLTKTLPRLGKAFDKALSGDTPLNSAKLGFDAQLDSVLPRFLGEFFNCVLRTDGTLLPYPCAVSVSVIRQVCYLFYKYKLPYTDEQEQQVLDRFEKTEEELSLLAPKLLEIEAYCEKHHILGWNRFFCNPSISNVALKARELLKVLFADFDPTDIFPRHGPGVVATKQRLWGKYLWSNVSRRITEVYPFDEYFCSSLGSVCDNYDKFKLVNEEDLSARVLLVPKDSRGPRLISCEPVDFQWVQQGLGRAITQLVEHHDLTRSNVFYTDQRPNQLGALMGSELEGRYATLDLNEASDRISLDLVRLLYPKRVYTYLEACRSSSTVLPNGKVLRLKKFAPMGSSLCFPILGLTIWAILTAAVPDAYTRDRVLVYGDDVIVPKAFALNAMEHLESFGLKVNRDKSCISGLFRESCGTDAFTGVNVTPVRLRTVWSSYPAPDVYTSWISYANSFYDKRYYRVYDYIVEHLISVYGDIPDEGMCLTCPSLRVVEPHNRPKRRRVNKDLQKIQWRVWDVKSPSINKTMDGWAMLLRYFAEKGSPHVASPDGKGRFNEVLHPVEAFCSSLYTDRHTSMLVRRWR